MNENLIGYLTDGLDEAERGEIEQALQSDAEMRMRLHEVQRALAPLAWDETPAPPDGLAVRTLARVAEHACRELPQAPIERSPTFGVSRSWWRRVDMLAAACLAFMALGIGASALFQLRSQGSAALAEDCKNNLREFYVSLSTFRDTHKSLPNIAAEAPRNVAGIIVPMLADAGVLSPKASIRCPANGPHLKCSLDLEAIRKMSDDDFAMAAPMLSHCYAWSLGYKDEAGNIHLPTDTTTVASSSIALLADRASSEGGTNNSPNHGGSGQNVLFLDGTVRYATTRNIGFLGDDIFCNQQSRVAAGLGPNDTVLGFSAARQ